MQLEGMKVVRGEEMALVEKRSIVEGASDESYMLKAGEGIAARVEVFTKEKNLGKWVTLLVGKGNNGGDAFVAGTFLLHRGFEVEAYHLVDAKECSPLCQKQAKEFIKAGGRVQKELRLKGVIVDGLLGTGFHGKLEGKIVQVIQKANQSKLPILAIDIPSGVNGNTGEIDPIAIEAKETLYLGMAKLGFFIGAGYDHIGILTQVDFEMDPRYVYEAKENGYLINEKILPSLLPPLKRSRHKYQAGYVIALAGSPGMPGAAILSCLGALKTGAGIVRLFHPEGMEGELNSSPYELIRTPYHWDDPSPILQEEKRAKACLIGPGLGRGEKIGTFLQTLVSKLNLPCVIDADGLYHLKIFPKGSILTPHHKEMLQLLGKDHLDEKICQTFTEKHEVTLVLKGGPTWIFHPKKPPLIIPKGDPGMATAGTGDVLTGMIAALLAQGLRGREAAVLAVYLHALSGEIAAKKYTSYSLIASDLIEALPEAFRFLMRA